VIPLLQKQLLIVSNRLPVSIVKEDDNWSAKSSPGGLVTALEPIMRQTNSVWVGWPGCPADAPAERLLEELSTERYRLKPVILTEDEIARYYRGHANKTIWPLFHDLLGHFSFNTDNWYAYIDVNRRFAEVANEQASDDSFIWIHDYQLLLVGQFLREMHNQQHLSFFLHIPFPSVDLFRRMPRNREVLEAMLQYDHLGFQTSQDRRNFIQCIKWFIPEAKRQNYRRKAIIEYNGRKVKVGHYPISIDFNEFNEGAKDTRVADAAWYLHENSRSSKLVLGLDRLDYTKGIPERFLAFERMFDKYPDTHGNISLIQVVIPSRLNVPDYQNLKGELDSLAGRINSRISKHGWIPIHYQFRELDRVQLLGHYRACDIALITPLRDGMNLVAKEYCAASVDDSGVLILSEFTGAARQMQKGALIVNPYDIEGTADAIYAAYVMDDQERRKRMRILRSEVKRNDVRRWVTSFMDVGENHKKVAAETVTTEPGR